MAVSSAWRSCSGWEARLASLMAKRPMLMPSPPLYRSSAPLSHLTQPRDSQIFGARVHGRLEDVGLASHALGSGIGQRRFADAGLAKQTRMHGKVLLVEDHPCGKKLAHQLFLADPAHGQVVRVRQVQG